jgi:hypothetical protein
VAIRWKDFPHEEIFIDIYSRLNHNAVERSADDSLRHILRRRLRFQLPAEHRQFIWLESRNLVECLRCTRDAYRAFTDKHGCSPAREAYWVILRFAILPTAIAHLRQSVVDYVTFTQVPGVNLSLLFGISTQACHRPGLDGTPLRFNLDDRTPATDSEIAGLAALVSEDTLLWLEDRRFGSPLGGGPFATDDAVTFRRSWSLCAMLGQMSFIEWLPMRQKLWQACRPWTEGLTTVFGCVQDELLSQCFDLWPDGKLQELRRSQNPSELESVAVPNPVNEFMKEGGVWTITFRGKTTRLPANAIGLDYISVILRGGNRRMSALDLQCSASGNVANSRFIENALNSLREESRGDDRDEIDGHSNLRQQDFTQYAILDHAGREKLETALVDLEQRTTAALNAGDIKKAERLQDEYDQIDRELEISCNIHGRPRVFNSENEKARISITQALTRAYRKIRTHSPEVADHLESTVARGSEFWYRDATTKWKC